MLTNDREQPPMLAAATLWRSSLPIFGEAPALSSAALFLHAVQLLRDKHVDNAVVMAGSRGTASAAIVLRRWEGEGYG